jgi:hypothetical protein
VIQFRLSVDALGQTRFGYSPLAEAAASLRVLGQRSADFVVHPWLREVRDQLGRVDLELLLAVAPAGPLAPDFLFAWSSDPGTTIEQQLNELARTSPGRLRGDLEDCWKGRSMPATLRDLLPEGGGEAGPSRLADAIGSIGRPRSLRVGVVSEQSWTLMCPAARPRRSDRNAFVGDTNHEVCASQQIAQVFDFLSAPSL